MGKKNLVCNLISAAVKLTEINCFNTSFNCEIQLWGIRFDWHHARTRKGFCLQHGL